MAHGFATPVLECEDLGHWGPELVDSIAASGVELVVIQGWPPGAGGFVGLLGRAALILKDFDHGLKVVAPEFPLVPERLFLMD